MVLASLVASFATLVTAHVALAVGLATREPRWRALLGLVVPPLAPYFGLREGLGGRATVWVVAALVYVTARVVAFLG